jgi:subtilisin family serine protease
VGLASTTGYTVANGTSFSAPITAGAMCLIRQRVREELNLDSLNPADRRKRYDTVTVARALLQNSATNLRNGFGQPQPANSTASINEMGSGHINIAEALTAHAVMVAPALLLVDANPDVSGDQREFNAPTVNPAPTEDFDKAGNLRVLVPTVSFGAVAVVRLNDTIVRTQEVIVRDVVNGAGGGTYNLALATIATSTRRDLTSVWLLQPTARRRSLRWTCPLAARSPSSCVWKPMANSSSRQARNSSGM